MKFLAISTFNAAGLDLYGRRMMESFRRNWPADVDLRVYSEGWSGGVDLISASPWLAAFKSANKHRTFRDFRWDAVRFAHKVAAVCHAAREDVDCLIWLDGDTLTHSPITMEDIEALAPKDGEWIAWLERAKVYPECGFYMLNCRHPQHEEMIGTFERMYVAGELYLLPEYHDSFVLEYVVKTAGVGRKSLSGDGYHTSHPLINGPLGKWLDHMKGNRKVTGRTPKAERRVNDGVPYWS